MDIQINKLFCQPLMTDIVETSQAILRMDAIPCLPYCGYKTYLEDGNRLVFEKDYYLRRKYVHVLALQLLFDKNKRTLLKLEEYLWEICNEYTWSLPAHLPISQHVFSDEARFNIDLNAAETAQMLAEVMEWHEEDLSDLIKARIKYEVMNRYITPFVDKSWWWENETNNWSSVIASCTGMIAISLIHPEDSLFQKIMIKVNHMLQTFLSGYGDDGGCDEGVGYWSYGFGYYCYFADKYRQKFNTDCYLLNPKLKKIAEFPNKVSLGKGKFVSFSDYNDFEIPSGLLAWLADNYTVSLITVEQVSRLDFFHTYRWLDLSRNLLWSKRLVSEIYHEKKHYFPDLEWLIISNQDYSFSFAAKGGHNLEAHNHNDVGSFLIADKEEQYIVDLGAGEYTKEYFDLNTRYNYVNTRSISHSVPIINGCEQRSGNYSANILKQIEINNVEEFMIDLTDLYPSQSKISSYIRTYKINCDLKQVIIKDSISFKEEEEYQVIQTFPSYIKPQLIKENSQINFEGREQNLTLDFEKKDCHYKMSTLYFNSHKGLKKKFYISQLITNKSGRKYSQEFVLNLKKINN